MKRDDILNICPEDFKESLGEYIDGIERDVIEIKEMLDIKSVDDIPDIKLAYDYALILARALY
jgi:hypothetical protein